jgi:hypothetical protein
MKYYYMGVPPHPEEMKVKTPALSLQRTEGRGRGTRELNLGGKGGPRPPVRRLVYVDPWHTQKVRVAIAKVELRGRSATTCVHVE